MNFVEALYEAMAGAGDAPLAYAVRGTALDATSGVQLRAFLASARGFLDAYGIKPGDRVGLCGSNSAQWIAADLAILGAGAIVVPLYERQSPQELAAVLKDSGAALVLVENLRVCDSLATAWPEHGTLALFDEVFAHAPGPTLPVPIAAQTLVSLIYTSGTSGEPKGVLYTRANIDFMLERAMRRMDEMVGHHQGRERMFHYLPFAFASSRITLWVQLLRRSPLYLSTDLKQLPVELTTARPHYFLNVPAMLEKIRSGVDAKMQSRGRIAHAWYRGAIAANLRGSRGPLRLWDRLVAASAKKLLFARIKQQLGAELEFLICGSAPLAVETQAWFELLGVPVYQVYGLTETTAIVTMDRKGQRRPGHVGRPIEDVELKLSADGELWCRGQNVFAGYWNKAADSAAVLHEGWFRTGDLAELSTDGDLKIVGRAKDLLVLETGLKVAPDPLEAALLQHLPGAQAIVVGHGRPYLTALFAGEMNEGDAETAVLKANAALPHTKQVRKFKVLNDSWSHDNGLLTANLKLRRRAVEARYETEIRTLYS